MSWKRNLLDASVMKDISTIFIHNIQKLDNLKVCITDALTVNACQGKLMMKGVKLVITKEHVCKEKVVFSEIEDATLSHGGSS